MQVLSSAPHWGVTSLLLTCLLTFFFNRMVTDQNPEEFRLRGGDGGGRPATRNTDLTSSDFNRGFDEEELLVDDDIPACARDVFVRLRAEDDDDDGRDERGCRGMLVRDDIVLTSRECSRFKFSLDFPDEKSTAVRAVPLQLKEEREASVDPRLGFLKTNAPSHYYFVDQPVMRTRMFLSIESSPAVFSCEGRRPVAHNFPVGGELVPLGHLSKANVLPRDILWKERDIENAATLEDKSHRWWTRRVSLSKEEKEFKKLMEAYRGPPGSVSIPAAHIGKPISQTGSLCEAVDPRGHRHQDCFKNYYFRWRNAEPFSGMHFFDWLDFGPGKDIMERNSTEEMIIHKHSDLNCLKRDFDRMKLYYLDEDERRAHEVYLTPSEDGREIIARYKLTDKKVPPSYEDYSHLYMWDLDEKFYVVDHTWDSERYGSIKHTAVLAGKPALSAGKAFFGKHGRLTAINWSSGHYRPKIPSVSIIYQWMKNEGLNVTSMNWNGRTKWTPETCEGFDWDGVQIPGYDAATLNRSCHEVTTGPTWFLKEDE